MDILLDLMEDSEHNKDTKLIVSSDDNDANIFFKLSDSERIVGVAKIDMLRVLMALCARQEITSDYKSWFQYY